MKTIRGRLGCLNPEIAPYIFMDKKGYGFEKENPILVKSVAAEYELIKRLHLKEYSLTNCILKDLTRESIEVKGFSGLVDHFELMFNIYTENKIISKLYDVYFCAYPVDGEKPYTANEKLVEFNRIINNDIDIKLPEDFTVKYVKAPPYSTIAVG